MRRSANFSRATSSPRLMPPALRCDFQLVAGRPTAWTTTRDHTFLSDRWAILIPAGSVLLPLPIPTWLLWLIGPLVHCEKAALLHAQAYATAQITREEADYWLYRLLRDAGNSELRALIAWAAVRLLGEKHYNSPPRIIPITEAIK